MTLPPEIAAVLESRARWGVALGDCLDLMKLLPNASVDAVVGDPPSGMGFMGKEWDDFRRSRNKADAGRDSVFGRMSSRAPEYGRGDRGRFVTWLAERLAESQRVLKPGGYALVWGIPKLSHWTAWAIEDAGFELQDRITHIFGSGSGAGALDVSKAIDKELGTTEHREIVGRYRVSGNALTPTSKKGGTYGVGVPNAEPGELTRTTGGSPEAKSFDGWKSQLKPAVEDWYIAMKPLDGTYANNALKHGLAGMNIDACRVGNDWEHEPGRPESWRRSGVSAKPDAPKIAAPPGQGMILHPDGRYPAHLVLSHDDDCVPDGPCGAGCPVRALDEQSGHLKSGRFPDGVTYARGKSNVYGESRTASATIHGDEGGASRYFNTFYPFHYEKKASRAERDAGCEHIPPKQDDGPHNHHPTVKNLDLMGWLCRLITRPGGLILDPFLGSGSTGCAAMREGFRFIGFEGGCDESAEYIEIARARIQHWHEQTVGPLFTRVAT